VQTNTLAEQSQDFQQLSFYNAAQVHLLFKLSMEYLFLGLIVWAFISLPALIYAAVVDGRRRRDADNFNHKLAELTREMEILERRTRAVAASATSASTEVSVPTGHSPVQKSAEAVKPVSGPIAPNPERIVQKPVVPVTTPAIAAKEVTPASPMPLEAGRPGTPATAASMPVQTTPQNPGSRGGTRRQLSLRWKRNCGALYGRNLRSCASNMY
jgi:hypothetical protein